MLRHIKDVLNNDVRSIHLCSKAAANHTLQSALLIIDTIIQSGTVSSSGPALEESLSKTNKNFYEPVPPPPFIPVDFGDSSRLQHQINVCLTALCNGE